MNALFWRLVRLLECLRWHIYVHSEPGKRFETGGGPIWLRVPFRSLYDRLGRPDDEALIYNPHGIKCPNRRGSEITS